MSSLLCVEQRFPHKVSYSSVREHASAHKVSYSRPHTHIIISEQWYQNKHRYSQAHVIIFRLPTQSRLFAPTNFGRRQISCIKQINPTTTPSTEKFLPSNHHQCYHHHNDLLLPFLSTKQGYTTSEEILPFNSKCSTGLYSINSSNCRREVKVGGI